MVAKTEAPAKPGATFHRVKLGDARDMSAVSDESVDLVVTSPPYPMIEMWDEIFSNLRPEISDALEGEDGGRAFQLMNEVLDEVWAEVSRVLRPGGIACINIGDATRTIGGNFALYPSHARILTAFMVLGFTPLPEILWRKQTNAPNKFMGSGMYPPGAYVTLEHEYVLVLRKGSKREFSSTEAKLNRRQSSYFWEERNHWFSDVWFDLKGTRQSLFDKEARSRSGAYPFELPYRLINMFSVRGDTVLDPFLGLGTTTLAAMASERNSVGYEIDSTLAARIAGHAEGIVSIANERIEDRLREHAKFVTERRESKGSFGYRNEFYGFPVVTKQEVDFRLRSLSGLRKESDSQLAVDYASGPQEEFLEDWDWFFSEGGERPAPRSKKPKRTQGTGTKQLGFDFDTDGS
ncbi:MAG: site-specific DNA-methyltransferase [Planctomycetota bacterium]